MRIRTNTTKPYRNGQLDARQDIAEYGLEYAIEKYSLLDLQGYSYQYQDGYFSEVYKDGRE